VPTSAVIVSFVDFLISGMILLGLMAYYNFVPDWRILTLPIFTLIAFAASMGVGLWLAALTLQYRDFRLVVPFIIQFGLYISPVGFSSSIVPDQWRILYSINPIVDVIDGFRWAILRGASRLYYERLLMLSNFLRKHLRIDSSKIPQHFTDQSKVNRCGYLL